MTELTYNKDIAEFRIVKEYHVSGKQLKTYAIHDYYGKNKFAEVDGNIEWVRRLIWQFKDGNNSATVANKIAQAFRAKGFSVTNACLMVIPASDPIRNTNRFRNFSNSLGNALGLPNCYDGITTVAHEATKGHAGGNKIEHFTFHNAKYTGKTVYLFDDVCTSATSFKQVAAELLRTGASNVIGLFLAKTVSTYVQYEPDFDVFDIDDLF
ncbi:phosphoribosyltransferase [Mucilaginibacter ginsenosidivorax]|uniref:Phosphoribosyltransferase n=1 Tax=Mucilaginibacter ginsenosidivorax TaxID=862126 RepID=A0A5B8W6F1_9SPHI|nr:phosphoribosyltransferase [Mucilaginibacter ginsenosidivorax]QEC77818.1 phosphoribosyltransferase [Mucilaginibacter ginsenosidivorax]